MQLHSDQGQEFEAHIIKQLSEAMGIEKTRTVAFHPAADGMVERYNQTIVDCIAKVVAETKSWDDVIASGQRVQRHYPFGDGVHTEQALVRTRTIP